MKDLTIVTSCSGYHKYLDAWAHSIANLLEYPGGVGIYTHGTDDDLHAGRKAAEFLRGVGIPAVHKHNGSLLDFGTARNRAVELSSTEWVMHLDCDDQIMPHAMEDVRVLAPGADVISFGYERSGETKHRPANRVRLYRDGDGLGILEHAAPCSGVSPFRRSFWERSPYRTDMVGAWDTALWIGFARLGARFRATSRPCFWYVHHTDSVFTQRRLTYNWKHAFTASRLGSLRRNDQGVAIIVPRDPIPAQDRLEAWDTVKRSLETHLPSWPIYEGFCDPRSWRKGEAVSDALARMTTSPDILVVLDADCLVSPDALQWSVAQVQKGAPWSVPHQLVYRLNAAATIRWRSTAWTTTRFPTPSPEDLARSVYQGYAGGGVFVVRRFLYEAVGGIPYAFEGWGGEDQAFALIMDTMVGTHVRGKADLVHLWHEPQPTKKVHTRNMHTYRKLRIASKRGPEHFWEVLQTLPGIRRLNVQVPPWKKKSLQVHGVGLAGRHGYLGRKRAGGQ